MFTNISIKVSTGETGQVISYLKDTGFVTNWGSVSNPFNNCQVFTIGWAAAVFSDNYDEESIKMFLAEAIKIANMRSLCVMDVHKSQVPMIKKALLPFTKKVHFESPYHSTNNSDMCIILVEFDLAKICK